MKKRTRHPWTDSELETIVRAHAEGKPNFEIYPLLPARSPSNIDNKMERMGLERNRLPNRENWYLKRKADPATDRWVVKVKFEDVSRETIEREWPTGKYWSWHHLRKTRNPIGNMWSEMVR